MSESLLLNTHQHEPKTTYLKDYQIPAYLIDAIDLQFNLEENVTTVSSKMKIRHNRLSNDHSKTLVLNGEGLTLKSIELDKQILPQSAYEITDRHLVIHHVPDQFELSITTLIYPQKNTALSGLYQSQQKYCTQCEAEGFRRITYFIDRPDILTRYTTTIIADESHYPFLLSNGNKVASGKLENNQHWVKWEDPFKKPCYLFALVAGDFDVLEDLFITQSNREIILRIYVEKGYRAQVHHAIYALKEAMRWDELTYGREYDLDIFMIVAIHDFNMGAMENKGLNIFNTKYILAKPETATDDDYIHILSVIGHEYFHNWTGNRVTCRDWFQLSLKEGLTIFRDQTFSEDTLSHAVMRIRDVDHLRESQFIEDAGPLAHPVRPDSYIEINNFYTTTVYEKGAEVLRMLRTILGKALFRKGMDLYFARHDGRAVTIEDYIKTMEDTSGIDLTQFRLWYSQKGTPEVSVKDHYDDKEKVYTLSLSQQFPNASSNHPMHIPIRLGLLNQKGEEIPLALLHSPVSNDIIHFTQSSQVFSFKQVSEKPTPSLFRDFSAPIKLHYDYHDHDLLFLFQHDKDPFNRWEAGQQYFLRLLLKLISDFQQKKQLSLPKEVRKIFETLLTNDTQDKWFTAECLLLPSEILIGEHMNIIDVDAIYAAREFMLKNIAEQCQDLFKHVYQQYHQSGVYQFSTKDVAERQLKNRCLMYLSELPQYENMVMQQFETSLKSNMTDTQTALLSLINHASPLRKKALEQFYDVWKNEALVVNKWFAVQALTQLPNALSEVKQLTEHEAFDIKNPNNVYALIGTFSHRNRVRFHDISGKGYEFLRDNVEKLDQLNPQVAARMLKPLTTWKRYDKDRQLLMRKQCEGLLKEKRLSPDLYELITKSLESS